MIHLLERRHGNVGENKYISYTAEEEMEAINKITNHHRGNRCHQRQFPYWLEELV